MMIKLTILLVNLRNKYLVKGVVEEGYGLNDINSSDGSLFNVE